MTQCQWPIARLLVSVLLVGDRGASEAPIQPVLVNFVWMKLFSLAEVTVAR